MKREARVESIGTDRRMYLQEKLLDELHLYDYCLPGLVLVAPACAQPGSGRVVDMLGAGTGSDTPWLAVILATILGCRVAIVFSVVPDE